MLIVSLALLGWAPPSAFAAALAAAFAARVRPQRLLVVELRVALVVVALEQMADQREASGASLVLLKLL